MQQDHALVEHLVVLEIVKQRGGHLRALAAHVDRRAGNPVDVALAEILQQHLHRQRIA